MLDGLPENTDAIGTADTEKKIRTGSCTLSKKLRYRHVRGRDQAKLLEPGKHAQLASQRISRSVARFDVDEGNVGPKLDCHSHCLRGARHRAHVVPALLEVDSECIARIRGLTHDQDA